MDEQWNTVEPTPDAFPRCRLHGHRLVTGFPRSCCLAATNPLQALNTLQGWAWNAEWDSPDRTYRFERLKVCASCVERLVGKADIKRLRARTEAAQPTIGTRSEATTAPVAAPTADEDRTPARGRKWLTDG